MLALVYSDAAQNDLVGAIREVSVREGQVAAEATLARLLGLCDDLARFPDMGRRRLELDAFGLSVRTLSDHGRLIVYSRRGDHLVVARVLTMAE